MIENGLYDFFQRFARFRGHINFRVKFDGARKEEVAIKVLGMNQLLFFFVVFLIQLTVTVAVFIIELIVHRLEGY